MSERPAGISRRTFIRGCSASILALPVVAALAEAAAAAPLPDLTVRLRSDWAAGVPAPGPLPQEAPGDVRFLIVHHSASANGYAPGDVPGLIRGFHSFHTGPEKGWPDVAYNFFVDRYGVVWEGRAGSLDGAVMPDATGGSQGFSQICCFIGDHTAEAPTAEAQYSMTLLLAGLAGRYRIDPSPGATTTFVSRGSNRWPAGATVSASTIAGHRDMSLTTCPGDAAYPLVKEAFPAAVAGVLAARSTPTPAPTVAPAPTTPSETTTPTSSSTNADVTAGTDEEGLDTTAVALVAGGAVAASAAAVALARRAQHRSPARHADPGRRSGDDAGATGG